MAHDADAAAAARYYCPLMPPCRCALPFSLFFDAMPPPFFDAAATPFSERHYFR
jgi:hypothetical protein